MARAKCVVCGVSNGGDRDFICEDCGDPNGVKMFCTRCRKRASLNDDGLAAVEKLMDCTLKKRSGVVLRLTNCADCGVHGEEVSTKIFYLKTN